MFGNSVSCANRTFLGKVYIHDQELLTDHHLDPNILHLFVHQRSFKKGAGELDLFDEPVPKAGAGLGPGPVWARAQGRHEVGPGVCMGQGSRCRTSPFKLFLIFIAFSNYWFICLCHRDVVNEQLPLFV